MLIQDTPDGSYAALEKKGKKQKANLLKELLNGFTNYRIWLLAACYAYSFGVEVHSCQTRHCCSPGPAFWHSFVALHVGVAWLVEWYGWCSGMAI